MQCKIEKFEKLGTEKFRLVDINGKVLHDGNSFGFKSLEAASKAARYHKLSVLDDSGQIVKNIVQSNDKQINPEMKAELAKECEGLSREGKLIYLRACAQDSTPLRQITAKQIIRLLTKSA